MALLQIPFFYKDEQEDSLVDNLFEWTYSSRPCRLLCHPYIDRRGLIWKKNRRQKGRRFNDLAGHDDFRVSLDVRNYDPEDVTLKVDGDKLIVKGKQRKESEYGYESSEFERTYPIPSDVDVSGFKSKINDQGLLEIEEPKIKEEPIKRGDDAAEEDEKKFTAIFDVSDYKPDEVSVKIKGSEVIVRGEQKSESKDDKETFVRQREFARRFLLPKSVKIDSLVSKWTKDGKLVIEAEKCPAIEPEVRQLEIEHETEQGNNEEEQK